MLNKRDKIAEKCFTLYEFRCCCCCCLCWITCQWEILCVDWCRIGVNVSFFVEDNGCAWDETMTILIKMYIIIFLLLSCPWLALPEKVCPNRCQSWILTLDSIVVHLRLKFRLVCSEKNKIWQDKYINFKMDVYSPSKHLTSRHNIFLSSK